MKNNNPIIIIGMPRSGTTFVANILANCNNVKVLIEPHILWRSGNFKYFADNHYQINKKNILRIRKKMEDYAGDKILVEKSPINCVRSSMVYETFPEAKIVYLERNKDNCIKSNHIRSQNNDSFNLGLLLKKYFSNLPKDLEYADEKMSFKQQIDYSDFFYFLIFCIKSLYYRNILRQLPFGPKLIGFYAYIKKYGLIQYHEKVYSESLAHKEYYKGYYRDNFLDFKLERLQTEEKEIVRLLDFCNLKYDKYLLSEILNTIDKSRIQMP